MKRTDLDPDLLRAFIAVADERSFTRAALVLNRTQSAVSAQIKRLEEQLGHTLFARSTARVDISPAGEGLLGYARRILHLGDEAVQRLRQHEVAGRVRLGVMDDYGTLVLPPILKIFCATYPAIELQLETGLTSKMVGRLGTAYDLVIAMHARAEKGGDLLRRERAIWVGSDAISPGELDPLPLALYPSGCLFREWAINALDRAGRKWRLAFVSHSLSAVEAFAVQGLAVTVVKASARPRTLNIFGADAGLPSLPTADIRLHVAPNAGISASLLAEHLRQFFGSQANRDRAQMRLA